MILEEGVIYTNADLAAWFGVKESTFKCSKVKKLEYLKQFADFEEIKGKVKILKVYESEYVNPHNKANNNKLYQKDIAEVIKECPLQMFKTCTARIQELPNAQTAKLQHKFNTAYKYTRENLRKIADGHERVWCQRHYDGPVSFTPLPEQQLKEWKAAIMKYLGNGAQAELIASWKSQEDNGEITKEEFQYKMDNILTFSWSAAKEEFYEQYHFIPDSVPIWQLKPWDEENK